MTKTKELDLVDEMSECPSADSPHWWQAAKAEHAALKQWKLDGENGDRPATPTLDEMNDRYVAAGCAPGSSSPKRTRSTSSTPRAPKMSDVDITRRLRELLDETPTLSQTAAVDALTAEGATIRQVRAAYKVETSNRPKPAKPAKRTTSRKSPTPLLTDMVDDMMAGTLGTLGTPAAKSSKSGKSLTPKVDATRRRKLEHRDEVLAELKQPHTAAELVAIAEREGVEGCRVKMGKSEIIDRISAAVNARTKHLQKSA